MPGKPRTLFIRAIGFLFGVQGIAVLFLAGSLALKGAAFLPSNHLLFWTRLPASFARAIVSLAVAWFSWKKPRLASLFAWLSLVIYVLSACLDTIIFYGIDRLASFIPMFYYSILAQSLGAALLTYLGIRNYKESVA